MSCPIKVNSNTIKLTAHTSCYCVLDLLCAIWYLVKFFNISKKSDFFTNRISPDVLIIPKQTRELKT